MSLSQISLAQNDNGLKSHWPENQISFGQNVTFIINLTQTSLAQMSPAQTSLVQVSLSQNYNGLKVIDPNVEQPSKISGISHQKSF